MKWGYPSLFTDSTLYNFGAEYERIFLRMPQLLESAKSVAEYEEETQRTLQEGIEDQEDEGENANPWEISFEEYHFELIMGHMYVADTTTFASEGPDAGKLLLVWYDECGRTIRSTRLTLREAADMALLSNAEINDWPCWVHGDIGQSYQWGQWLGPPYGKNR